MPHTASMHKFNYVYTHLATCNSSMYALINIWMHANISTSREINIGRVLSRPSTYYSVTYKFHPTIASTNIFIKILSFHIRLYRQVAKILFIKTVITVYTRSYIALIRGFLVYTFNIIMSVIWLTINAVYMCRILDKTKELRDEYKIRANFYEFIRYRLLNHETE